jgi:hypothetical protein
MSQKRYSTLISSTPPPRSRQPIPESPQYNPIPPIRESQAQSPTEYIWQGGDTLSSALISPDSERNSPVRTRPVISTMLDQLEPEPNYASQLKFSDDKSYTTDFDVQTTRGTDTFDNASEEEKSPARLGNSHSDISPATSTSPATGIRSLSESLIPALPTIDEIEGGLDSLFTFFHQVPIGAIRLSEHNKVLAMIQRLRHKNSTGFLSLEEMKALKSAFQLLPSEYRNSGLSTDSRENASRAVHAIFAFMDEVPDRYFLEEETSTLREMKGNPLLSGFLSPLRNLLSNTTAPDNGRVGGLRDELVGLNGSNEGPASTQIVQPHTNTGLKSREIPGSTVQTTHRDASSPPSRGFWLHYN